MLIVQKILIKLYGEKGVTSVTYSPKDGNKINYIVTLDDKKCIGCVFYNAKLTVKDVRNILFAYKKREIKALGKEASNVNTTDAEVRTGVNQ
jgi:hypothetical protein